MSRMRDEVNAQIASATSASALALARLRLAIYEAKLGNADISASIVESVRSSLSGPVAQNVYALLNIAEGVRAFYLSDLSLAREKIQRAIAISKIGNVCSIERNLARAWLGHIEFVQQNVVDAAAITGAVLAEASGTEHEARARACQVMACVFLEIGDFRYADAWYRNSREHAIISGDDTMIGATIYNRAAFRIYNARMGEIDGTLADLGSCDLELEALSATNYSAYTGNNAMSWMLDLLRGQLCVLQGRFADALQSLESDRLRDLREVHFDSDVDRRVDAIYSRLRIGEVKDCADELERLEMLYSTLEREGDKASVAHRLSQCFSILGDGARSTKYSRLAALAIADFRRYQDSIRELVSMSAPNAFKP